VRHRLEERPEHLAALVADVAHHLELLVDDHEELVDLLLVAQEVEQAAAYAAVVARGRTQAEGAGDGVHPHVAAAHGHVPLGAGAHQVALAGEEHEGPVGAVLALEQLLEHRERLVGAPVGQLRPVMTADDEVGALALADLVPDDGVDDLGVGLVVGLEAAPVGELDRHRVDGRDHVGDGELVLHLDVDHRHRRPVVVDLEAALGDLPERHRDEPVAHPPGLRNPRLQRDVQDGLRLPPTPADDAHRVAVARARAPPDDRPRVLAAHLVDGGPDGVGLRRHAESLGPSEPGYRTTVSSWVARVRTT
jgi:hypothetical protein